MPVKIEGFIESTVRNEDGSIAYSENFHNKIMVSARSILAKNISYKNKGGAGIIMPRSYNRFSDTILSAYPEGFVNASNADNRDAILNFNDGINDDAGYQYEYTRSRSNGNWPVWYFIKPSKPSVVRALTIDVFKIRHQEYPYSHRCCTPCNWYIYGTNDSNSGSSNDGTFTLIKAISDDTWPDVPINGINRRWFSKVVQFDTPQTFAAYKIIITSQNPGDGTQVMDIKSIRLHENIMGLQHVKIGTSDLTPENDTLVDLISPVFDSNSGFANGYTSGTKFLGDDVSFEYPNLIKMRYKWINTTASEVIVKEIGAFDYNNNSPIMVSRVVRNTPVKRMQYLDDVYKIKISVV